MQIVVKMAMRWAGDRTITHISLHDYELTVQRVEFLWKFAKPIMGSRVPLRLFSWKSGSTRGCNRSHDAPEDVGPAICESRVAQVWYGRKENSLRLLSFLGFKAALFQPRCAEVIYHYGRTFFVIVPVFS